MQTESTSKNKYSSYMLQSFVRRNLVVYIIFLIIPLFIYFMVAFWYEYYDTKENLFQSLQFISKHISYAYSDSIQAMQAQLGQAREKIVLLRDRNAERVLQELGNDQLLVAILEDGKLRVIASSNPTYRDRDCIPTDIEQQKNGSYFFTKQSLLFTTPLSPKEFLCLSISLDSFFQKITSQIKMPFTLDSYLLDKTNTVYACTRLLCASSTKPDPFIDTNKCKGITIQNLSAIRKKENIYEFSLKRNKKFSVIAPIPNSSFSIASATKKRYFYQGCQRSFLRIGTVFLMIIITGGGVVLLLTYRFAKPLQHLYFVMKRASQGDLKTRYKPDRLGFEINSLGKIFNETMSSLDHFIQKSSYLNTQKEVMHKELLLGREVQRAILPKETPQFAHLDIAFRFFSAKEVGGDFYDVIILNDHKIMFLIGDTVGKGIFACFYSLVLRSILRSFTTQDFSLAEIIKRSNSLFLQDTEATAIFVTLWAGIYDTESHLLTYTCCGHHPSILRKSDGTIQKLETEGMALGIKYLDTITCGNVNLSMGDTLLLYTDGIVEAYNATKKEYYSLQKLMELYQRRSRENSQSLVDDIFSELFVFSEKKELDDDAAVLAIMVN